MTPWTTTLRVGDTLHVLAAGSPDELRHLVRTMFDRLVKPNGHAVVDADGRAVHVIDEEIHPTQWHTDGNRVRARRVRYERKPDGSTTSSVVRTVWIRP